MSQTPVTIPGTVAEVFDAVLAVDPGREALVTRAGRWSYAELDALANRAAHALRALGLAPGDRVAVSLPNDADIVLAFHGAMRLGAVFVGVNRILAPPEKQYLLTDSGASLLVCDEDVATAVGTVPGVRIVTTDEWRDALDRAPGDPQAGSVDPDAPAGIAYTSGTTGHPKGAVHSQRNLLLPGAVLVQSRGWDAGLRKGDFLALTILNLQVLTTLTTAQAGGCAVIMDRSDAPGIAEWTRREAVTVWNGPPALVHSLVHDDSVVADDLASLVELWTGGSDCPEPLREAFAAKFGRPVLCTYGLTEAPTVVSIDAPDGSTHVPGASGPPLPHLDVTVVDGELCVGPRADGPWAGAYGLMLGYWGRPEATADVLRDGVLHTGDLGHLDADGNLVVRDRKSLLILRGGGNVYPAEVERVLHELDAVAACAVVGLPDERLGERVAAVVQLEPGASVSVDELAAHCAAHLARYKVPERWVFVDEFPRNAMGKVKRAELAALFDA